MTAAGATAAPRRGAARRQMARGGSVPQLLGVVCCAVLVAAVSRAEADGTTFVGVSYTSTSNPGGVCSSEKGGFLPNLIDDARDKAFAAKVDTLGYPANIHIPLSGTIGKSACNAAQNCVWQWRGGPYEATPVTFYVGNAANVKQDPEVEVYYRWRSGYPSVPLFNPRASFYSDNKGWANVASTAAFTQFLCEVPIGATSKKPGDKDTPGTAAATSSGFKWWIGVAIGVGTAVVVIILVIIFFRCCRGRKPTIAPVSDEGDCFDGEWVEGMCDDDLSIQNCSVYDDNGNCILTDELLPGDGLHQQSLFSGGMLQEQMRFGGGMQRQQSFGGATVPAQQMCGGGMVQHMLLGEMQRQPSFAGGMQRQPSFGGGMVQQQSFGGGMPPQQQFLSGVPSQPMCAGGMPAQLSFGGGMVRQGSFGGVMPPLHSFGGGM